jgi:hypothetical protein
LPLFSWPNKISGCQLKTAKHNATNGFGLGNWQPGNLIVLSKQGEHLARRQELLGFNRGDNRFTINRGETVSPLKSTREIAKDIGLTERSAQQRMQAARNIIPEVKDAM